MKNDVSKRPDMSLVPVRTKSQWRACHSIRQRVLYELRGRTDYDAHHPDDHAENHIPFLLVAGEPLGTARLDLHDGGRGTVRLVAVLPEYQRRGFGRELLSKIEAYAVESGLKHLDVHAAPDAVPFYLKLGWSLADSEADAPLLTKALCQYAGTRRY